LSTARASAALQTAVTLVCRVLPERRDVLARTLLDMGADPDANPHIPFARLSTVHFARLFTTGSDPQELVYMSDVDGTAGQHLADLVDVAGAGLDAVFGSCAGWPGGADLDGRRRLEYLTGRLVRPAATYVNTAGRTVRQVLDEQRLRDAIEQFLDQVQDTVPDDPVYLRAAVQAFVAARPELSWALTPAPSPGPGAAAGRWLRIAAVVLAALALLPLAVVALPVAAVLLRLQEIRDVPSSERTSPARLAELAAFEDRCAQNPFSAVSPLRRGWLRALTLRSALAITAFVARDLARPGGLLGLETIHFFRLLVVGGPDGDRLMFGSTFDGSLESYIDDFIDRIALELNAIFGNADGYPRTSFLVFGGARREREFKDYVHVRQVPVPVFYSAYPDLTAVNAANNAAVRAGLSGTMSRDRVAAWLRRL
jgi:hypothetical protein